MFGKRHDEELAELKALVHSLSERLDEIQSDLAGKGKGKGGGKRAGGAKAKRPGAKPSLKAVGGGKEGTEQARPRRSRGGGRSQDRKAAGSCGRSHARHRFQAASADGVRLLGRGRDDYGCGRRQAAPASDRSEPDGGG